MKVLYLALGLAAAASSLAAAERPAPATGPEVGEKIPAFRAADQHGVMRDFESLQGPNGLLLLFHRSADWCPYCKGQLAQLERKREDLEKRGVNIAAISYDDVAVLKHFTDRVGIGFPLLSDPDSKIIRDFGILNTSVASDHPFYGIPHPGEYLVNPDGTVRAKFFEASVRDRFTGGRVLVTEFNLDSGGKGTKSTTDHLDVTAWSSDEIVRGGNRVALVLDVELPEKMHVYAPNVENYIPVSWKIEDSPGLTVDEPSYPESKTLHLEAINERAPVYEGRFRVIRDVLLGQPDDLKPLLDAEDNLTIRGSFRYQACDDKVCYLPQTIALEWKMKLEQHDRERAPEELRRD